MKRWATNWKTVQIPEEYYTQIGDFVEGGKSGYASISEYVRAAVREKLRLDFEVDKK